ncbi:MAG TPA: hypothetical protein VGP80_00065 [Gemmatimonadales bacterium]|nr:hypothetical protein [Gemmatimonadales bacterium]
MRLKLLVGLLLIPALLPAQGTTLRAVAEQTRGYWQAQDARGLVNQASQLLLQLPEADPSAPVDRDQAAELLRDFFHHADEVETRITDVREMDAGLGLVELRRRFRVRGTQEIQEQRVLLSYRASGNGWMLVELRISR